MGRRSVEGMRPNRGRTRVLPSYWAGCAACGALALVTLWAAAPSAGAAPLRATEGESVKSAICRYIDQSAARARLPASFLTRLIWSESSFRSDAISSAGAQGVAQFMPGTAAERGLANPFDPQAAIEKSAELLADLEKQFGNLGLAAAAYNAGPARVAAWLAQHGGLPLETQMYVLRITGRSAQDWADQAKPGAAAPPAAQNAKDQTCLVTTASLRVQSHLPPPLIFAPWGVQLAAGFSRAAAVAAFTRNLGKYRKVIGDVRPMIIGSRLLSRGYAPFYRIRIPEPDRQAADRQCNRILSIGGACVALRS